MSLFFTLLVVAAGFYLTVRIGNWLSLITGNNCLPLTGLIILLLSGMLMVASPHNLVAENRFRTYVVGLSAFCGIYLLMGWLLMDLVSFIFSMDAKVKGWIPVILCIVCAAAGMIQTGRIAVVPYTVSGMGIRKRIILLSDLHIGYYVGSRHIRKVVSKVNSLDGDLIVIAGDMINDGNTLECPEIRETEVLLSSMKSAEGTYACTGNHDPLADDEEFMKFLDRSGIRLLQDEAVEVNGLQVVGRNTEIYPRKSIEQLHLKEMKTLLIDHDPCGINEAVQQGIDVVVCGHTHRGQLFPFQLFTRLVYKKWQNYGLAVHGKTTSIVSSGAGFFSMPMRLGSRCEVVVIDMQ